MQPAYPLGGVAPGAEELLHRVLVAERAPQPTEIMIIVWAADECAGDW